MLPQLAAHANDEDYKRIEKSSAAVTARASRNVLLRASTYNEKRALRFCGVLLVGRVPSQAHLPCLGRLLYVQRRASASPGSGLPEASHPAQWPKTNNMSLAQIDPEMASRPPSFWPRPD